MLLVLIGTVPGLKSTHEHGTCSVTSMHSPNVENLLNLDIELGSVLESIVPAPMYIVQVSARGNVLCVLISLWHF